MKIYCCQLDIAWEDKPANYRKVRGLARGAGVLPGSLVVLPEMFATGFSMNVDLVREPVPSPTAEFLSELAGELKSWVIGGVVNTGPDGRTYNQALVFGPQGREITRYSKIHPFTLGGESTCYAAGNEVVTFNWADCVVAPFVCYDLRFPEIFREAVGRGAEILVIIANWPVKREMHWVTLLQARAIENQAYIIGVNRCGQDPKYFYSGRSLIADPHGLIVTQIGEQEGVITTDADLAALRSWRHDFPALRDRHWKGAGHG